MDGVFVLFFVTESHYIAQAGLDLVVFPPQPPECRDYRMALPYPVMALIFFSLFFFKRMDVNNNICSLCNL